MQTQCIQTTLAGHKFTRAMPKAASVEKVAGLMRSCSTGHGGTSTGSKGLSKHSLSLRVANMGRALQRTDSTALFRGPAGVPLQAAVWH